MQRGSPADAAERSEWLAYVRRFGSVLPLQRIVGRISRKMHSEMQLNRRDAKKEEKEEKRKSVSTR